MTAEVPSEHPPGAEGAEREKIDAARRQAGRGSGGPSRAWAVVAPDSIPGYEIVREIHAGGQGVVYQAIQKATKRKVAIKIMRESPLAGSRGRARFEREVEILGQLNHPNIVSIIDSGEAAGCFYFVMDYISGHPLDVYMSSEQRSIEETLRLFARICEVVNVAHQRGVIHRDLKPGNIRVDGAGEPHVLDFGLAKTATGDVSDASQMRLMTMTGQFIGSLPWAIPEQAEGSPDKVDVRTDVYSLGVVLYQMLTGGKFPYEVVGNMRDVLDNILKAQPARPSTIRRQINDEVETIVLKTLSKERDRRYQTAGELGRDVRRYLAGEPIEAKRDSGWYVVTKLARRHRAAAGVAAGFLVLLIAFGATMSVLYRRAVDAERAAEAGRKEAVAAREAEEAERLRAEQNFDAVRALARTFMFDFHDHVAELRGGTAARELILGEAKKYLEAVRAGGAENPAFLRELAEAHERVGQILGGDGAQRAGDTDAADAAFAEARRIRERLLSASPGEAQAHADVARSVANGAFVMRQRGRHAEARAEYNAAIAGFDRAIGMAGGAANGAAAKIVDERIDAATGLGDTMQLLALQSTDAGERAALLDEAERRYDEAARHWRARLDAGGADGLGARRLGAAHDRRTSVALQRGRILKEDGDRLARESSASEAIERYDEAIGRFKEALRGASASLAEFERLSGATPQSVGLRRGIYVAAHNAGEANMRIANAHAAAAEAGDEARAPEAQRRREEALRLFSRALAVAEGLGAADEANLEAQRDLAVCLNKVGNELRDLGRLSEAAEVFGRSLAVRREMLGADDIGRHVQDLGVACYKLAQVEELLGDGAPAGDRAAARRFGEAARLFQESVDLFTRLAAEGGAPADSRELRAAARGLERCREKMGKVGAGE